MLIDKFKFEEAMSWSTHVVIFKSQRKLTCVLVGHCHRGLPHSCMIIMHVAQSLVACFNILPRWLQSCSAALHIILRSKTLHSASKQRTGQIHT